MFGRGTRDSEAPIDLRRGGVTFEMKRAVVGIAATAALVGVSAQPLTNKLDGPDSVYTEMLAQIMTRWPSTRRDADEPTGVHLACMATANAERYVGILRRTKVKAAMKVVEGVLDDVAHYKELFPGTVGVRIVARSVDGTRFVTAWEQRVPVFLFPNVTYELSHLAWWYSPPRQA